MTIEGDRQFARAAWALILGFSLLRLVYAGTFLLAPDEANYWQWGRYLDWGYHDQAPMIGWVIRLSTTLFGETEIAVRLPSVMAMAVASAYMVAIALRWFSAETAFFTAVLTQSVFEFNLGGLMATPDGLQAAAWAGAVYHVARAYETGRLSQWLGAGALFGFGMLSKFTMVIFLPGAFLYGLLSRDHRQQLAGLRPYAGVLLGLLVFLPVVLWNHAHNWNSVRHVAHIGGADEPFVIHLNFLGDYIGSQAALLSPLVFLLLLMAWARALRPGECRKNRMNLYLFLTSFTMFAGFAVLSLHSRVYGNWPGAGYVGASVLAAAFYSGRKKSVFGKPSLGQRIWPVAILTSYLMTGVVLLQVIWPVIPVPLHLDRLSMELSGWDALGEKAGKMAGEMPNPEKTFIFALNYQEASELAYYAPGRPRTVSINKWSRPNVYDYWFEDKDLLGWDGVGVTYGSEDHLGRLSEVFDRVDPPVELKIHRQPVIWHPHRPEPPVKRFFLYRAYGFRGGLRWRAPDPDDIRIR